MSISDKLILIKNSISAIKEAIINQGQTPAGDISTFAQAINDISGGGGSSLELFGLSVDSDGLLGYIDSFDFVLPSNIISLDEHTLYHKFLYNNKIQSADFNNLKYLVGANCMYGTLYGCENLKSINLDNLEEIKANQGMYNFAQQCSNLESVNLDNLKKITGNKGLGYAFFMCNKLRYIRFKKLEDISGEACLSFAFQQCNDMEIYFDALNENSFGSTRSSLTDLVAWGMNNTIHFPVAVQYTIGDWQSVISGFNGSNTIVLFDLNACELTFNIVQGADSITIWNREVVDYSIAVPKNRNYSCVIKKDGYPMLIKNIEILDEDSKVINEDLSTYNSNTLSVTVENAIDVKININGIILNPEIDGNTYSITVAGNPEVELIITGDDNHSNYNETIILDSNIDKTVILNEATYIQFEQPTLTSNGELGGDSFAVSSNSLRGETYLLFDKSNNTHVRTPSYSSPHELIIYNPIPIKLKSFTTNWYIQSSSYESNSGDIYGSNDGITWESINSFTRTTFSIAKTTIEVNSPRAYYYYKLSERFNTYWAAFEITLDAEEKR